MTEGLPYYDALLARALELAESHDWQTGFDEFDILKNRWSEGPEVDDVPAKDAKYNELLEALKRYADRRKGHYDQLNERRTANAQRREDLLKRLSDLIDTKRWAQYAEVASIQHKFEEIRPLPTDHEEQDKRFAALLETFNHHKVEYLVKVRQREDENLLMKLMILEKMKQHTATVGDSTVWADSDTELETLSDQWRKVGKVAKEKSDEVWEAFKQVRDSYSDLKLQHDSKYRGELEKNQQTRIELCDKAEALLTETDLAVAAKEMNLLHKRWKETGPTFREQSEVLWERFKAASDKFNNVKHENLDVIRDAEQHNYEAKEALCLKAEALSSAESKDHGHDVIESLFKEWNAIGPVPRRKNKKIWGRFKTAIDAYQTHRRSHFKQARIEQKDNLTRKREIIDKLTAMAEADVTDTTAAELKQLQQEFQGVGFVPIKLKEKVWNDYRAASDAVYKKVRAVEGPSTAPRQQNSGAPRSYPQPHRSSAQAEPRSDAYRLKKEADSVNELMLHYMDAITYIKPNKGGNVLRDEIQAKIDAAKVQLDKLKAEIEALNK